MISSNSSKHCFYYRLKHAICLDYWCQWRYLRHTLHYYKFVSTYAIVITFPNTVSKFGLLLFYLINLSSSTVTSNFLADSKRGGIWYTVQNDQILDLLLVSFVTAESLITYSIYCLFTVGYFDNYAIGSCSDRPICYFDLFLSNSSYLYISSFGALWCAQIPQIGGLIKQLRFSDCFKSPQVRPNCRFYHLLSSNGISNTWCGCILGDFKLDRFGI